MMIKNTIRSLCFYLFLLYPLLLSAADTPLYHLGPIKIERINGEAAQKQVVKFNVYNTTGMPVRYFSINCKILKDGYLIDERTCNGFGIDASSFKEVHAKFLWLPEAYDVDFEINTIRTERLDLVQQDFPSQKISQPERLQIGDTFENFSEPPMDFIDNKFEIGTKYQLYRDGEWFPND